MLYRVRSLSYNGRVCGVVLQQQNGPCPIIAIANVLSLRGHLDLRTPAPSQPSPSHLSPSQPPQPPSSSSSSSSSSPPLSPPIRTSITFPELTSLILVYLRSSLLSTVVDKPSPSPRDEAVLANALANFDSVSSLLPLLERGLDVNPLFTHTTHFEYTDAIALFDLCQTRLLHGWLIDPSNAALTSALRSHRSFNEASAFVLDDKAPPREVALVRRWLDESASQLTMAGLRQLLEVVREDELCVHFRNNHFATITKKEGRLLHLCTDEGLYRSAPHIAWVQLVDVKGNDVMLNETFSPAIDGQQPPAARQRTPSPQPQPLPTSYLPAYPPPPPRAPSPYYGQPQPQPQQQQPYHQQQRVVQPAYAVPQSLPPPSDAAAVSLRFRPTPQAGYYAAPPAVEYPQHVPQHAQAVPYEPHAQYGAPHAQYPGWHQPAPQPRAVVTAHQRQRHSDEDGCCIM